MYSSLSTCLMIVLILIVLVLCGILLFYTNSRFRHSFFPLLYVIRGSSNLVDILGFLMKFEDCSAPSSPPLITYRKYIFFGPKYYVIGDVKFAKHILKSCDKYKRATWSNCANLQSAVLGAGSGDNWRRRRFSFHEYFLSKTKGFNVNNIYSNQCKNIIIKDLNEWTQNSNFFLCKKLMCLILKIHCKCILNLDISSIENWDEFTDSILGILDIISTEDSDNNIDGINNKYNNFIKNKYFSLIYSAMNDNKTVNKLVGENAYNLTATEIAACYSNIVLALTPVFAIFWFLFVLYQKENNKHLQKCINSISNDDIYLKMCLMEVIRMYCPIPILLERICIKNDNLYNIPKGSRIVISPQIIQNLNYNNENPHKFEPKRWENKVNNNIFGYNSNFLSFGFGTHLCLGNTFFLWE
eukprot:129738_1